MGAGEATHPLCVDQQRRVKSSGPGVTGKWRQGIFGLVILPVPTYISFLKNLVPKHYDYDRRPQQD